VTTPVPAKKVRQIKPPVITPIPQPDLTPQQGRPWFRLRRLCFTLQDWQVFGDALRIACPYASFMRNIHFLERSADEPPQVSLRHHIGEAVEDAKQRRQSQIWMYLDPAYLLDYTRDEDGHWKEKNSSSRPYAYMDCYTAVYQGPDGTPDYIGAGELVLAVEPNNDSHAAFARAFFSLLGKFASNRHQYSVSLPSYRSKGENEVNERWLGHHAIRWLLEDSKRVVNFMDVSTPYDEPEGRGYRPIEEIWHKKLGL
jgi:hypothetical protein